MSADLVYISGIASGLYVHFNDDGTETPRMEGTTIEVFVPNERRADIDRNDDLRRELAEKIDQAITSIGG